MSALAVEEHSNSTEDTTKLDTAAEFWSLKHAQDARALGADGQAASVNPRTTSEIAFDAHGARLLNVGKSVM
jgi:hypothetical protein